MVANQLKAFIVRDLAGYDQFYRIFNSDDRTIKAAVDVLKSGKIPVKTLSR